jgi:hypothetical protein
MILGKKAVQRHFRKMSYFRLWTLTGMWWRGFKTRSTLLCRDRPRVTMKNGAMMQQLEKKSTEKLKKRT